MSNPIIILTDFGTQDPFVGIMKGVINTINPDSPIIDLTHEIPPGDIRLGALTLWQSISYFPKGSVFLTVVDPGVGTHRHPLILKTRECTFIGPDNGVFSYILDHSPFAWKLTNPKLALDNPGMTFHGRDIFAPAAAYAAQGIPGSRFGPPIDKLVRISTPKLDCPTHDHVHGEIIHIDRFGNALTSLGIFKPTHGNNFYFSPWISAIENQTGLEDSPRDNGILIDLRSSYLKSSNYPQIHWVETFGDIDDGACAFLVGSSGLLEIAANQRSASEMLNIAIDDPITLITFATQKHHPTRDISR